MNQSIYRRHIMANLVVGAMALVLCACGERGLVTRDWSEEVELEGGTILIAKRHVVFRKSSAWGGDSPLVVEKVSEIDFGGVPGGSVIPKWSVPLIPLLLYSDETRGQWVIVATTQSCTNWNAMGAPPSLYWEFRSSGNVWVEVPPSRSSVGRQTNFYPVYPDKTGVISLETKRRLMASYSNGAAYKTIVEDFKPKCPLGLPTEMSARRK